MTATARKLLADFENLPPEEREQVAGEIMRRAAASGLALSGDLKQLDPHNVLIPDSAQVTGYLAQFSELRDLLPAICAEVRQKFGKDAELSLGLYRDPEIDDCYLTLYIRMNEYKGQIMDQIHAVRAKLEDRLSAITGHLLITTDFRRPRGANAV